LTSLAALRLSINMQNLVSYNETTVDHGST